MIGMSGMVRREALGDAARRSVSEDCQAEFGEAADDEGRVVDGVGGEFEGGEVGDQVG